MGSMLPSLGGGLPQVSAPRSTGLALFDEIEIKENDTAEEWNRNNKELTYVNRKHS